MSGDAQNLSIRLRQEFISRLDDLIPHVSSDSRLQTLLGRCTRSDVARLAMLKGIEALEQEYQQKPRRGR
ncbi:MAG: hypothetical protein H6707_18530 [Deltaproteobacteria bacterium]|nr:hypothetical protein [Deltaproteobacteria bacterium]